MAIWWRKIKLALVFAALLGTPTTEAATGWLGGGPIFGWDTGKNSWLGFGPGFGFVLGDHFLIGGDAELLFNTNNPEGHWSRVRMALGPLIGAAIPIGSAGRFFLGGTFGFDISLSAWYEFWEEIFTEMFGADEAETQVIATWYLGAQAGADFFLDKSFSLGFVASYKYFTEASHTSRFSLALTARWQFGKH